jgi:LacI family transcriptional regulator, galactose operon repressor
MATLEDVAKAAGVSITTASRVLNRAKYADRIGSDCARRVREVAQRVGYNAGYHRRAINSGLSETLGVALDVYEIHREGLPPLMTDNFFSSLVAGVEQAMRDVGYNLAIVVPGEQGRAGGRGVLQVREGRLDALVLCPTEVREDLVSVLKEAPELPIVAIEPTIPTQLPTVRFDHRAAGGMIVDHLAKLGHRHLLWFGPEERYKDAHADDRALALQAAATRCGLTMETCHYRAFRSDPGRTQWEASQWREESLAEYLGDGKPNFTAIVAYNDAAAVSACRLLTRRNLRVPQDISVTGIDNLEPAFMTLPLTTVDHRLVTLGQRAGKIALEMVNGGPEAIQRYRGHCEMVEPVLHVRESTAPAPR